MSKKAFDKIAEGLEDAIGIARGEILPPRLRVPPDIDVKGIRRKLGHTQEDFASAFGFTISQIKDWEQTRSRPLGGMRAYLMLIERNPDMVLKLLHEAHETERAA